MRPTRLRLAIAAAVIVTGGFGVLVRGADAHHPEVAATAVCANGTVQVSIRSTSWETDEAPRRYNSDVSISFDGVVVGRGAFLPTNGYTFTITTQAVPDGGSHIVRATALAAFGPAGEFGDAGAFREAAVTLPSGCQNGPSSTTTSPPTATTTTSIAPAPTSTTVAAPSTTSTVPVAVGGIIETRPEARAALPVEVAPRFAG
jgi:hypothetical protein